MLTEKRYFGHVQSARHGALGWPSPACVGVVGILAAVAIIVLSMRVVQLHRLLRAASSPSPSQIVTGSRVPDIMLWNLQNSTAESLLAATSQQE